MSIWTKMHDEKQRKAREAEDAAALVRLLSAGVVTPEEARAAFDDSMSFSDALVKGYAWPTADSVLRIESLGATLRVLTFDQSKVKLWKDIPK